MRDFGKVYSTFWTSDSTRDLSDRARLLAVYLLSGPHTNMIGCFRLPDGYVMEDLGWNKQTVSEGFAELFRKGFATRENGSKWVLITNYLKWNSIENPNQGKSAARLFEQIPNSLAIKSELATLLEKLTDKFPFDELERFRNGFETVSKPGEGEGEGTGEGIVSDDLKSKSKKPDSSEAFDAFWLAYPRKESKKKARAAFDSAAIGGDLLLVVIADVKRRAASLDWKKDNGKYIPMPVSYLNARRWEDEGITISTEPEEDDPERAFQRWQTGQILKRSQAAEPKAEEESW